MEYKQMTKPCKNGHMSKRYAHNGVCYECCRLASRAWYHKNKTDLNWRKDRIIKCARNRANINNVEFDITVDDLDWPEKCPVFDTPLDYFSGDRWNAVSLDRTDSSKGYTKGNVKIISMKANSLKNASTLDDLRKLVIYMENLE